MRDAYELDHDHRESSDLPSSLRLESWSIPVRPFWCDEAMDEASFVRVSEFGLWSLWFLAFDARRVHQSHQRSEIRIDWSDLASPRSFELIAEVSTGCGAGTAGDLEHPLSAVWTFEQARKIKIEVWGPGIECHISQP
jgi:hypothetical protein